MPDQSPEKRVKAPFKQFIKTLIKKDVSIECQFVGDVGLTNFREGSQKVHYFHFDSQLLSDDFYYFDVFKDKELPKIFKRKKEIIFDTMVFKVTIHQKQFFSCITLPNLDSTFYMYIMKECSITAKEFYQRLGEIILDLLAFKTNPPAGGFPRQKFPEEINQDYMFKSNFVQKYLQRQDQVNNDRLKIVRIFPYVPHGKTPEVNRDDWLNILFALNDFILHNLDQDNVLDKNFFQKMYFYHIQFNEFKQSQKGKFHDNFLLVPQNSKKYFTQDFVNYMYRMQLLQKAAFEFDHHIDIQLFNPESLRFHPEDHVGRFGEERLEIAFKKWKDDVKKRYKGAKLMNGESPKLEKKKEITIDSPSPAKIAEPTKLQPALIQKMRLPRHIC